MYSDLLNNIQRVLQKPNETLFYKRVNLSPNSVFICINDKNIDKIDYTIKYGYVKSNSPFCYDKLSNAIALTLQKNKVQIGFKYNTPLIHPLHEFHILFDDKCDSVRYNTPIDLSFLNKSDVHFDYVRDFKLPYNTICIGLNRKDSYFDIGYINQITKLLSIINWNSFNFDDYRESNFTDPLPLSNYTIDSFEEVLNSEWNFKL